MPITYTALGTYTTNGDGPTVTVPNITMAAGATLVLGLTFSGDPSGPPDSVTWNSQELALAALHEGVNAGLAVYYLATANAGTHDIVASFMDVGTTGKSAFLAVQVAGALPSSFDAAVVGHGSGASASSGYLPTTAQAEELLVAFLATEGPSTDAAPSWASAFIDGQRAGTTGGAIAAANSTLADAYRIVSEQGVYAAQGFLQTPRDWRLACLAFKADDSANYSGSLVVKEAVGNLELRTDMASTITSTMTSVIKIGV